MDNTFQGVTPVILLIEINMQEANEFLEYILDFLEKYKNLGPLPGILLPFIEAFFPFLPLFVFVLANGAAYGLLKGFLYSWIGASLGSICVSNIVRRLGHKSFIQKIKKNKQVKWVTSWVEKRGFGLLFILLCFPFTPSALIDVVAGLSRLKMKTYMLAVLLGKAVMIFSIAYVGSSIVEFAKNPLKTIIIIICIVTFWLVGKLLEKRILK